MTWQEFQERFKKNLLGYPGFQIAKKAVETKAEIDRKTT